MPLPNVGNSDDCDDTDRVPEQCLSEPSTTCMVNNHDMEFSHDATVRGITMQFQTYEERHRRVVDGWFAIRDSLFATYVAMHAPALHQLCSHCFKEAIIFCSDCGQALNFFCEDCVHILHNSTISKMHNLMLWKVIKHV